MKCHVLIPVGPGHEQTMKRALESVRIAMRASMGPFSEIKVRAADDTKGEMGRSKARNLLVQQSDADWVFFLDADDLMHPRAFEAVAPYIEPYLAVWGSIWHYIAGVMCERWQSPVTCYEDLLDTDPYLTLQIGHFVERDLASRFPFAEDMNTGEDFDYYLRLWKNASCVKIDAPLMLNVTGEHSTGPKSANGQQWVESVQRQQADARTTLEAA